jgi:uncharacterized membrane protein
VSNFAKEGSRAVDEASEYYQQRTVQVAISGIIAALYATMLIVFSYFSFGPIQIRVADSLMPLALIFGYAAAIGLGIGCLVGNYFGLMTGMTTPVDVVGGALANLLAGIIAYRLYRIFAAKGKKGIGWSQMAIMAENIIVTLIVGTYMGVLYTLPPDLVSSLVFWYVGVFSGSLVSMNIIGYIVYKMTNVGLL